MNPKLFICSSLCAVTLTACQHPGQGTAASDNQSGLGRENGSTLFPLGRMGPNENAGLSDSTIAASREEGALDVSGSGSAELARRSAAATLDNPESRATRPNPPPRTTAGAVQMQTADDILLARVKRALDSTTPTTNPITPALSIQTLNNLRITVKNGIVTLRGRVNSLEEKDNIAGLVRDVPGIQSVNNQLEPADASAPPPSR